MRQQADDRETGVGAQNSSAERKHAFGGEPDAVGVDQRRDIRTSGGARNDQQVLGPNAEARRGSPQIRS